MITNVRIGVCNRNGLQAVYVSALSVVSNYTVMREKVSVVPSPNLICYPLGCEQFSISYSKIVKILDYMLCPLLGVHMDTSEKYGDVTHLLMPSN